MSAHHARILSLAVAVFAGGCEGLIGIEDPELGEDSPPGGENGAGADAALAEGDIDASRDQTDASLGEEGPWRNVTPAESPPPRTDHAMAYDGERVILFGGFVDGTIEFGGGTWAWDGVEWEEVASEAESPSARAGHAMTYDAGRGEVILFGGSEDGSDMLADTWIWDGDAWEPKTEDGPPARALHAMAYDASRDRVVLFGGGIDESFADTWEWDGDDWQDETPEEAPSPPERSLHAMAYDPALGATFLFGGSASGLEEIRADVWLRHETGEWVNLHDEAIPGGRSGHTMVYDPTLGTTLLFGGGADFGLWEPATLEWAGDEWEEIPVSSPPARGFHSMAYDAARNRVVLFGGTTEDAELRADTWEWAP